MFELVDLIGVPLRDAMEVLLDARATRQAAEVQEAIAILHIVQNYHRDLPENPMPGRGRLIELAAEGGPRLNEFVPLELSAALGVSQQSISLLISDLLDLEHRHPLLWQQVRDGETPLWHARKIAARVSNVELGLQAALELDRRLSPTLPGLTVGRSLKLLEGMIVAIDPRGAEERAETERRKRWVRIQPTSDGVSWLDGKLNCADGRQLDGALNRIAFLLKSNGDSDDREARRSSALGILSNPALALALLQREELRRASEARRGEGAGDIGEAEASGEAEGTGETGAGAGSHGHEVPNEEASSDEDLDAGTTDQLAGVPADLLDVLATIDPRKLLPRSTLFVHVSDRAVRKGRGVARVEGIGPVPLKQLRHLLKGTRVRVLPVFDPGAVAPVDSYEIPAPMRRAVLLRNPTDTFPFGSWPSRGLDLDHVRPYRHDGGPGQTCVDGLQPLIRRGHRAKTHGKWLVEPDPMQGHLWRSPLGLTYWVLPDGRTYRVRDSDRTTEWARSGPVSSGTPSG